MKAYAYILSILLYVTASCQTNTVLNTVLICKGTRSYAYHDHHCEGLNRCRAAIEKVSVSKAKSLGRTPCKYCYQTVAPTSKKQTVLPAAGTAIQSQCTATTKKRTRCLRTPRSNARCWQHGG